MAKLMDAVVLICCQRLTNKTVSQWPSSLSKFKLPANVVMTILITARPTRLSSVLSLGFRVINSVVSYALKIDG